MRVSTTRVAAIAALCACAALGLRTTSASAAPDSLPTGIRWTADLGGPASDAVNVRRDGGLTIAGSQHVTHGPARTATVLSAPHATGQLVTSVRADLDATVPSAAGIAVAVRGQRTGGVWTEWRDAGTALPAATATVQARVTLTATGASPVLRSVRLTGTVGAPALAEPPQELAAWTYRVYATREGLVGSTTANGHVIASRDHFVALPSRRGLSPKGSSQYSVMVCNPSNGRCETGPVWDVGPWNTKDDYWNPSSQRQMWQDLPQGQPEAQAAYQDGYNNREDEFGRTVSNPAGIDLADGTFYDGLGMIDNGWVNVTYLWTGDGTPGGSWPTVHEG